MFDPKNDYEFNLLNIENYNLSPRMIFMKKFIENKSQITGDYYEFGVFQGSSIISIALLFKKLGITKKLYGFDSFEGFPSYSANDSFSNFDKLYKSKKISKVHYAHVINLKKIKEFNQRLNNNKSSLEAKNISSSNDFSNNSYSFLKKKIKLLGLKNIILIKGDFKKTIPSFFKKNTKKKVFAANIDCDLYDSYTTVLTHTWPRLNKNGIILLDEYYSLKFPGARIAADDFFKINKIKPFKKKSWNTDFERWYIKK
jgi:hypothetical protein